MPTVEQTKSDRHFTNTLIAAVTSGLVGASSSFVFKGLKIRLQSGQPLPSISQLGPRIWIKESFRGSLSYTACLVSTSVVQQVSDRFFEEHNTSGIPLVKWSGTLLAGALGGITYNVAENIILQQQRHKMSAFSAAASLVRESPTRIFRGLSFIMPREAVFGYSYLKGAQQAGDYAKEHYGESYIMPAKIMVGIMGALASHPFDTASVTMQAYGYTKMRQAVSHLLAEPSPVRAIYKGGLARIGLFTTSMLAISMTQRAVMDKLDLSGADERMTLK